MTAEYEIRTARSDLDLHQILALQAANLRGNLTPQEREAEGFLTLRHEFSLLRDMCGAWGHVIATAGAEGVVAYALVMLDEFRARVPELDAMFRHLERASFRGQPLTAYRSYIMGQICVAKAHRSRGLVRRLYAEHRARMSQDFDLMITDIDRENPRSLRAHLDAGFEVLAEYPGDDGEHWIIVVMDLRADSR